MSNWPANIEDATPAALRVAPGDDTWADEMPPLVDDAPAVKAKIVASKPGRQWPPFIPITELPDDPDVDWIWGKYVARRFISLLCGYWKAGKTTLLTHIINAAGTGGEVAGEVEPCKVLYITEEHGALWKRRVAKLGIGRHVEIAVQPFRSRPSQKDWDAYCRYVADTAAAGGHALVVFDTITGFWSCTDENDAGKVEDALKPIRYITDAGAGALLVHHPRKGDGAESTGVRGSGQFTGFVDIILEFRRYAPEDKSDRRRTIETNSRFEETPTQQVIEFTGEGYRILGTKIDASRSDRLDVIEGILMAAGGVSLDSTAIRQTWPTGDGHPVPPGKRMLEQDLKTGTERGTWMRSGAGKKGDPFTYSIPAGYIPVHGADGLDAAVIAHVRGDSE